MAPQYTNATVNTFLGTGSLYWKLHSKMFLEDGLILLLRNTLARYEAALTNTVNTFQSPVSERGQFYSSVVKLTSLQCQCFNCRSIKIS